MVPEVSSATGGATSAGPRCALHISQPVPEHGKFCPKKQAVLFQELLTSKQVMNAILAALPTMLESVLENSEVLRTISSELCVYKQLCWSNSSRSGCFPQAHKLETIVFTVLPSRLVIWDTANLGDVSNL